MVDHGFSLMCLWCTDFFFLKGCGGAVFGLCVVLDAEKKLCSVSCWSWCCTRLRFYWSLVKAEDSLRIIEFFFSFFDGCSLVYFHSVPFSQSQMVT